MLEVDRELGRRVAPQLLEHAVDEVVAAVRHLRRGAWEPGADLGDRRTPACLLVLEGVLVRTVCLGRYRDVELLGRGDVLSPWRQEEGSVPTTTSWRVVEDASVAVLDRTFEVACARYPSVLAELTVRTAQRAQRQAFQRATSHVRGLEARLLILLWHLADRWGRVDREGVVLSLRLSQETLAELVGARRPSASSALRNLERSGRIARSAKREWLLRGLPPDVD